MTTPQHRRSLHAAGLALVALLSGCHLLPSNASSTSETSQPGVVTSTVTITASPATTVEKAADDAEKFRRPGSSESYAFSYNTGNRGICVFNEEEITCQGAPIAGLHGSDAITATRGGIHFGVFEDVPQSEQLAPLRPNQRLHLGSVRCVTAAAELNCSVGEQSFSITGPSRTITAYEAGANTDETESAPEIPRRRAQAAPTAAPQEDTAPAVEGVVTQPESNNRPQSIACGVAANGEKITVRSGAITCPDAAMLMDYYNAVAFDQGLGGRMLIEFDGWACTRASRSEIRASGNYSTCQRDDVVVATTE